MKHDVRQPLLTDVAVKTGVELKTGFCALCRSRCGATFTVEDGVLEAAGPNPDHPTGAALCVKGKAAPEILYSPERILRPLRRTTPKTDPDPQWKEISWDEALDEIAARLSDIKRESGAEGVAFSITSPSGSPVSDGIDWVERFIRHFGSPNTVYATELCNWHKDHAHKFTFGTGLLYPEYENADAILLWGFNPSAVWLEQATQVAAARARGATVIAVDPRDAGFARDADHWLRVLPGRDAALALGLAHIMLKEHGYHEDFVRQWTNAPFLVRSDTGEFLRARDVCQGLTGDACNRFVVLDVRGQAAILQDRVAVDQPVLAGADLFADVTVETVHGGVPCRSAFSLFAERCAAFPLARVEAETSIPAEKVARAARALIDANAVAYYAWTGVGQHANATQTDRAIATLMALKGCYDAPGGNVAYAKHPTDPATGFHQYPEGQLAKALGVRERPLGPPSQGWVTAPDLYEAILNRDPYPVRGLMVFGANLAVSHPDTDRAQEALRALEFHVHCDAIETPTARFADIFLPVSTMWEREGLRVGFEVSQSAEELIQLRQPMVERRGEARSDTEIVFDLACRVGLGEVFHDGDIDAAHNAVLKPAGVTVSDLRASPGGIRKPLSYRPQKYAETIDGRARGFDTNTGRVEIYSELFLQHGYDPLPNALSDAAEADDEDDNLILTTAKSGYYTHSSQRHIPSLRRRAPKPTVQLSPDSPHAEQYDDGDLVQIETQYGRVRMELSLNPALHPRVAVASYGWWQANEALGEPGYDPFSESGANYNRLISGADCDPVSGAPAMRSTRCWLSPIETVAESSAVVTGWKGFIEATVTDVEQIAEDVKRVSLQRTDQGPLIDYRPGQHVTLRFVGVKGERKETRSYSLIGPARDASRATYDIAVRRVVAPRNNPDLLPGIVSNHIHEGLRVGDAVLLKAPSGTFTPPEESDAPIVLIAGGIGITPFLSYLETVARNCSAPRIHLVYANRSRQSHAFADQLAALNDALPTLSIRNIYEHATPADLEEGRCDKAGFVDVADIFGPMPHSADAPLIYQCGPPAQMDAMEEILAYAGHPLDRLFRETFGSPRLLDISAAALPKGPFKVVFSKSQREAEWVPEAGSLLALSDGLGLHLNRGCQAGDCETCVQKILSGAVMYPKHVAFDEPGHCLACQAVPASDLVLDA